MISCDYDYSDVDYATAVAAAASAILSLEESKLMHQGDQKVQGPPHKSLKEIKGKEDAEIVADPHGSFEFSAKQTEETLPTRFRDKNMSLVKKKVSFGDVTDLEEDEAKNKLDNPALEKTRRGASIRRPPAIADKQTYDEDSKMPQAQAIQSTPDQPAAVWPMNRPVESKTQYGHGNTKADEWERTEMATIKERYGKRIATIEKWETKKKNAVKRTLERMEAELDKRRSHAKCSYQDQMVRIEGIARGARAQAEENCRNEEFKMKDKANKIRSTPKLWWTLDKYLK